MVEWGWGILEQEKVLLLMKGWLDYALFTPFHYFKKFFFFFSYRFKSPSIPFESGILSLCIRIETKNIL